MPSCHGPSPQIGEQLSDTLHAPRPYPFLVVKDRRRETRAPLATLLTPSAVAVVGSFPCRRDRFLVLVLFRRERVVAASDREVNLSGWAVLGGSC